MRKGAIVLAFVSLALLDCATLNPLAEGACGNGVIDANEDCDLFAPSSLANGKCGQPGEGASACRLKCAAATDCPDGWGCGVTGVCREPSSRFGAIGEGVSAGVETMVVGDFDGDRRKDVLGSGPQSLSSTAKVRVHYFGDNAALAQVTTLSAPISSPTVKDFNKDGIDDFAFGLDIGALGVMSGQPDRSVVPAVFPSIRVPSVDAKPVIVRKGTRALPSGALTDFLLAGTFKGKSGTNVNAITSFTGEANAYFRDLPVGVEGIIGDPIWATFLEDPSSTCGEIALAMKSGPNGVIQVFAPCRPKGVNPDSSEWASARPPVIIDPPAPLEGGIHVIDETNDGHFDILFSVQEANTTVVYLSRSNATGFDAPMKTALRELPIASGDFDLDGKVDFVLPSTLALSNRGPAAGPDAGADGGTEDLLTPFRDYVLRPGERRVRWTNARVGYFNGDGLLDVVAASDEQPDIDFFGAVSPGVFSQSTISTAGPVSRLALGDFDGDKLSDVGFIQKRPGSGNTFDVAVAYARPNGPPEAARVVGRTDEVLNLETIAGGIGGAQGLALFFREQVAAGGLPDLAIAIIIGNGDRQPVAPLLLSDELSGKRETDPDIQREWVPLEVHAAAVADANRVDLMALAVGYRFSRSRQELATDPFPAAVWVAQGKGGTAFDEPRAVQDLGGFGLGDRRQLLFEARSIVGDIDNPQDGKGEFVVFQRDAAKGVLQLYIARPDAKTPPQDLPGESIRRDAPITLVDVDGDGNLDIVVILGDGDGRKVFVFYNDAKGGFIVPGASLTPPEGEVPAGFAWVTTAGASTDGKRKAKRELAVVTNKRIVLAAPSAADRLRFDVRDLAIEGGGSLLTPTAIVQGDFDGDGVEDLAVADGGALRIVRQLPVKR